MKNLICKIETHFIRAGKFADNSLHRFLQTLIFHTCPDKVGFLCLGENKKDRGVASASSTTLLSLAGKAVEKTHTDSCLALLLKNQYAAHRSLP